MTARALCGALLWLLTGAAQAGGTAEPQQVIVHFFSGAGCPHCEEERPFLARLGAARPGVVISEREVWHNEENGRLFRALMGAAKVKQAGVPATIVGNRLFLGFSESTRKGIEDAVDACLRSSCPDAVGLLAARGMGLQEERTAVFAPFAGELDPARLSLPVFTVIIAVLDSFNPCAFFVLLFLLSLLIHTRARARMLMIGGVFVLASSLVYFLFMAAWLTVFMVIGRLQAITAGAGLVAAAAGALNVKDFFFFKTGPTLSIPEAAKPKLFGRMRRLLASSSPAAMLGGAAVLALAANAYELLCTAGFPMIYTRVLTLRGFSPGVYYSYLALYAVVYALPLAVIVVVMTATLGANKMTEWQGRRLKLLSGMMMISLGAVLAFKPELLNRLATSIALPAAAALLAWLISAAARKLRPDLADS